MDASSTLSGQPPSSIRHLATQLRRVASMGMTEAGYRGWQASAKWIDRRRLDREAVEPVALLRREAPAIADLAPGRDAVLTVFDERFFTGTSRQAIEEFRHRFPQASRQIMLEADQLLQGRFDLLGYRQLSFGTPIDWQLEPVRSRRAPLVHWSQIDPLNASLVGDSKIPWELSRHQWVVRLAQAFALSGDARYEAAAVDAIDHWITANPTGRGLNWASSLEVAFRVIAWTWVVALLRDGSGITADFTARLCASIHAHATHVRKYLSYYFSPNTHLTGEALGLFYAGVMFPHFRDAHLWRDTGMRILAEQAAVQISDEGLYFEHSTCYQRYTCEFYLHFLVLAARAGVAVPPPVRDRVQSMIDFLVAVRRPDGSMPLIGDADDGCLMPLARRAPEDFDGVFAVAAAWFRRPDYAASGSSSPEVSWLLGPDGVRLVDALERAAPAAPPSRAFEGGCVVMRSSWDRDAHQMIVDTGPLGCHISSGHGHEDLLAIQCSVFGEPVIVDPGTYGYSDPSWRNYFRSAAAHSTITIDGLGHSEPAGPFGWRRRPRAVLRDWTTTAAFDLVDAEHNGYAHLPAPLGHRRRVLFVKPSFWIVIDDVTGAGVHAVDLVFQFAPLPVELTTPQSCRVVTGQGAGLWVLPSASAALSTAIRCGDEAPKRGWVSHRYGQKQPSPALVCSTTSALPLRAVTVLYPTRDSAAPAPAVDAIHERGTESTVRLAGYTIRIDHDRVDLTRH